MRVTTYLTGLVCVAGLVVCPSMLRAAGTVTESGSDAFSAAGWGISPTPDLVSTSATFDASYLYLSVNITPGFPTIDPSTQRGSTTINIYLDTDQNSTTGSSYDNLGYERIVSFASNLPSNAFLRDNSFANLGSFSATYRSNGFDTKIPLTSLGDDGLLNFKVNDAVQVDLFSSTPVLDVLPNIGLAASTSASVAVPEPATIMLLAAMLPFAAVRRSLQRLHGEKANPCLPTRNGSAI